VRKYQAQAGQAAGHDCQMQRRQGPLPEGCQRLAAALEQKRHKLRPVDYDGLLQRRHAIVVMQISGKAGSVLQEYGDDLWPP